VIKEKMTSKMLMVAERVSSIEAALRFLQSEAHEHTREQQHQQQPGHTDVIARSPTASRTRTHIISPRWSR